MFVVHFRTYNTHLDWVVCMFTCMCVLKNIGTGNFFILHEGLICNVLCMLVSEGFKSKKLYVTLEVA